MNIKILAGGSIAMILLGLYAYSVILAIQVVLCAVTDKCTSYPLTDFTEGFSSTMATVGGLVSALVISELAITPKGGAPGQRLLDANSTSTAQTILKSITAFYLLAWLGLGLAAFVIGVLKYPGKLADLTNLGKAWLGLAIASGYAYFGIEPGPAPAAPPKPDPGH